MVIADADGSHRRVVTDVGRVDLMPAWSPDGQQIAFVGVEEPPWEECGGFNAESLQGRRIWVVGADRGDKHRLTSDIAYRDEFPRWSRDGQHILFVRAQNLNPPELWNTPDGAKEQLKAEVWIMRADGSEQRKVAGGLPDGCGYYGFIDWSQHLDWFR